MNDSNIWDVDLLAAKGLLAELKLDAGDEIVKLSAGHFSRHRRNSYKWAAERVHSNTIDHLEASSQREFARRSEQWTAGFHFAEQCILRLAPEQLLELGPERTQTKGQILRSLLRKAKRDGVERPGRTDS